MGRACGRGADSEGGIIKFSKELDLICAYIDTYIDTYVHMRTHMRARTHTRYIHSLSYTLSLNFTYDYTVTRHKEKKHSNIYGKKNSGDIWQYFSKKKKREKEEKEEARERGRGEKEREMIRVENKLLAEKSH